MSDDPTKLNPPLEWDGPDAAYAWPGGYRFVFNFGDDDDASDRLSQYALATYDGERFYLILPEWDDMDLFEWPLEEAHAMLVQAAVEDGALPANIIGRKEGDAPQTD
jgi:hypothetical protein